MRQTRNTKLTHLFQTTKFYFFRAISLTVNYSREKNHSINQTHCSPTKKKPAKSGQFLYLQANRLQTLYYSSKYLLLLPLPPKLDLLGFTLN